MLVEVAVSGAISGFIKLLPLIPNVYSQSDRRTIEEVKAWFDSAIAFVEDTDGREDTRVGRVRAQKVRDLAFETQYAIDEYMFANPEHYHFYRLTRFGHKVWHLVTDVPSLWRLSSRMKEIRSKIETLKDINKVFNGPSQVASSPTSAGETPSYEICSFPRVPVGMEKLHEDKLCHLFSSAESMDTVVISVIGDPDPGITFLIHRVYGVVKESFEYYAFVTVPRTFECFSNKITELLPKLKGKRYILVVDGIFTIQECNCIKEKLLHNYVGNNQGSRIIISTCDHEVASYSASSHNYIYDLNRHPLTLKMAWELFCKTTFKYGICPSHLVEWSEKIVTKCEQSVFTIVAAGNFLSKKTPTVEEFMNLHNSLECGPEHPVSRPCYIIFLNSYHHLSRNHKACILYFCNFPGDDSVKCGRLVRLWIAEGFIEEKEGKTLETVAYEYLEDLVRMNLVQVTKYDFQGRVRSCRVSNLLRGFILSKAENDNFFTVLRSQHTHLSGKKTQRLSLHNCLPSYSQVKDLSCVHTFSVFGRDNSFELMARKLSVKFKFLQVLDLENADLRCFPEEVVNFTLLRYLSLRNTKIDSVPKSINKLLNLMFVDLRQTLVTKLPKEIHKLRKLLHLLVGCIKNIVVGAQVFPEIESMTSLQKLSNIKANHKGKSIVKKLKNLTELRKLGITELKEADGEDFCASIKNMKFLTSLSVDSESKNEYLDLDYEIKPPKLHRDEMKPPEVMPLELLRSVFLGGMLQRIPIWVYKLKSLLKLKLKGSKLQDSPLKALQALPSLKELYLYDAYSGRELEISAISFLELKILEIEKCSQLMVVALKVVVPKLQKLTVKNCGYLSKVYITKKLYKQLEVHVPQDIIELLD